MKISVWSALLCLTALLAGCGGGEDSRVEKMRSERGLKVTNALEGAASTALQPDAESNAFATEDDTTWQEVSIGEISISGTAVHKQTLFALAGGVHPFIGFLHAGRKTPPDLAVSIQSPNRLVNLKSVKDGWNVEVDTSALAAGTTIPLIVNLRSKALRKQTTIRTEIVVLDTKKISASIPSFGASVAIGEIVLRFEKHSRRRPIDITIRQAKVPDAGIIFRVDVATEDLEKGIIFAANGAYNNTKASEDPSRSEPYSGAQTLLQELETTKPYPTKPWKSLNVHWYSGLGQYVSPGHLRLPEPVANLPMSLDLAWELHSLVSKNWTVEDWVGFQPVLFVHGFAMHDGTDILSVKYPYLSGGRDTWGGFPNLVKQFSDDGLRRFVPFEYRWNTDTSFLLQGRDLAEAIRLINKRTGHKVIVVAHSFGGLLSRAVLQQLVGADYSGVANMVDRIYTTGTPHSGIADEAAVMHGVALPKGQDGILDLFEGCNQASCHVAGEPTLTAEQAGLLGLSTEPGEEVAELFLTSNRLPSINFVQGVGNNQYPDPLQTGAMLYGSGDDLISHHGQRLFPDEVTTSHRRWQRRSPSGAVFWEQDLGLQYGATFEHSEVVPVEALYPEDGRARNYLHTRPPIVWLKSSVGAEANIPAETKFGCDKPDTCNHGSWRLFVELIKKPPPSEFELLHSFDGNDGIFPGLTLTSGFDGNLYGSSGNSVFKATPSGVVEKLLSFSYLQSAPGKLVALENGDFLFSVHNYYGPGDVIYTLKPDGTQSLVHSFVDANIGTFISWSVLRASDGNFYGLTFNGGVARKGSVFKLTPSGEVTTLYEFPGGGLCCAQTGLIQGKDGYLYGTTNSEVFKLSLAGSYETLYVLNASIDGWASSTLMQAMDGKLYGVNLYGGEFGRGTAFSITTGGKFKLLHSFGATSVAPSLAYGELVEGAPGVFYGSATFGGGGGGGVCVNQGVSGCGVVYRMSASGDFTILHAFQNSDGAYPNSGLLVGADGSLFGLTTVGGQYNRGTLFRLLRN